MLLFSQGANLEKGYEFRTSANLKQNVKGLQGVA